MKKGNKRNNHNKPNKNQILESIEFYSLQIKLFSNQFELHFLQKQESSNEYIKINNDNKKK